MSCHFTLLVYDLVRVVLYLIVFQRDYILTLFLHQDKKKIVFLYRVILFGGISSECFPKASV